MILREMSHIPKVYLAAQAKSKEYLRIYIDLIISITTNKSFIINCVNMYQGISLDSATKYV